MTRACLMIPRIKARPTVPCAPPTATLTTNRAKYAAWRRPSRRSRFSTMALALCRRSSESLAWMTSAKWRWTWRMSWITCAARIMSPTPTHTPFYAPSRAAPKIKVCFLVTFLLLALKEISLNCLCVLINLIIFQQKLRKKIEAINCLRLVLKYFD